MILLFVIPMTPATSILAQRGAQVAKSARETADESDIVLACLPNLAARKLLAWALTA